MPPRGGTSFERSDYLEHGRKLLRSYQETVARVSDTRDSRYTTTRFLQVESPPERPIKAERAHLKALGLDLVRVSSSSDSRGIVSVQSTALRALEGSIARYASSPTASGKTNLAAIEAISPIASEERVGTAITALSVDTATPCLVSLFSRLPRGEKRQISRDIMEFLSRKSHQEARVIELSSGAVCVAAALNLQQVVELSGSYTSISGIALDEELIVESAVLADALPAAPSAARPACKMPVAIIDSGITDRCSYLSHLVVARVGGTLPPKAIAPHYVHGTFVASRIAYGDRVDHLATSALMPWCSLIDVPVVGRDGLGNKCLPKGSELLQNLERVIPELKERTRVFNVSLGIPKSSATSFSQMTASLDSLARAHDVVVVLAAGNIEDLERSPPLHYSAADSQILSPSEALLCTTVGALAKDTAEGCCVPAQCVPPYSRRGPGADDGLKPELVASGGNVRLSGNGFATGPKFGVYGLAPDGDRLTYGFGTSYSAPLVSQYAARLFDALPAASANLVRSFLYHFTDDVHCPAVTAPVESSHLKGLGEHNIDRALAPSSASVIYIHEGQIKSGDYQYIPFYVPPCVVSANVRGRLLIKVTLVFDPPVDADNPREYCKGRISVMLRKRDGIGLRDVQVGSDDDDQRTAWNPTIQISKSFSRAYSSGDWELRLRLQTRGGLPSDFVQTFATIIEVLDTTGGSSPIAEVLQDRAAVYQPMLLRIAA